MDATTSTAALATDRGRRLIITAMLVSTFMAAAEVTIISTAMPTIVAQLGGFDLFTWAFGVYLLGQAVTTPIYGRLADLYGRRATYLGSTALFLAGSLLCGFAWSMPSLIVFRAIQGLGGGGLLPLATIILSDLSTPEERPRVLSWTSGTWGVAAIAGPLLGSLCVGTIGWPFVFWINLPVGLVTMALVARHLREPAAHRTRGHIDLAGAALLAAGVGAGMAALIQWNALPARTLLALAAAAAVCLGAFAWRERGRAQPMLAAHLLRRPVIAAANVSTMACGALSIAASAFLPPATQGVLGEPAMVAGLVIGVMTLSWVGAAILLGRLLASLSQRAVAVTGAVMVVMGMGGLLLPGGLPVMLLACVPMGAGLGTSSLVFTVAVQSGVDWEDRGRATSLFYFSRLLGQAVGAAVLGGVLNAGLAAGGPEAHGALRSLMDPAARAALHPAELARLTPVLAAALHGVFTVTLFLALVTVPAALFAPRRRA